MCFVLHTLHSSLLILFLVNQNLMHAFIKLCITSLLHTICTFLPRYMQLLFQLIRFTEYFKLIHRKDGCVPLVRLVFLCCTFAAMALLCHPFGSPRVPCDRNYLRTSQGGGFYTNIRKVQYFTKFVQFFSNWIYI